MGGANGLPFNVIITKTYERIATEGLEQHSRNQKDFGIVPKLGEY